MAIKRKGFTLIELLVVISIISLLSSIILAALNTARAKARDATRLSDMHQIQISLELYRDTYGNYPYVDPAAETTLSACGGYDAGYVGGNRRGDTFIQPLVTSGTMKTVPVDPTFDAPGNANISGCGGYLYRLHNPGDEGCSVARGSYYILGVIDMETSNGPYHGSPNFVCANLDYQNGGPPGQPHDPSKLQFEWLTGAFQN